MAARTFRGTNNKMRNLGDVTRNINRWLEKLGDNYVITSIHVIDSKGPYDETLVWVNATRLTTEDLQEEKKEGESCEG